MRRPPLDPYSHPFASVNTGITPASQERALREQMDEHVTSIREHAAYAAQLRTLEPSRPALLTRILHRFRSWRGR